VGTAGLLTAVQAALPTLIDQHTGTILVTGSGVADHPIPGYASLGVQKAAVRHLALALAGRPQAGGHPRRDGHRARQSHRGHAHRAGRRRRRPLPAHEETAGDPANWTSVVDLQ
jgi:hypothetical protein